MSVPKDSRTLLLEAISEEQFQQQVIDLATLRGWRHYHTRDSRRSAEGFPDLVLVRLSRIIFSEIKAQKGRPNAEQRSWLTLLLDTGKVEVYIWRPSDWERLVEVLT